VKLVITLIHFLIGSLGAAMSWSINHSVYWAIFHYIVSVFYIPYWIVKYTGLIEWLASLVVK
jgi:hypothetical protein